MECKICKKVIKKHKNKHQKNIFCSRQCYLIFHKAKPFIKRKCLCCDKEFAVRKKTTKYCSRNCASKTGGYQKGHKHSEETLLKISKTKTKYPTLKTKCKCCNTIFAYKADKFHPTRVFCSHKCNFKHGSMTGKKRTKEFKKMLSEKYTGSGNPIWRGGISVLRRGTREKKEQTEWRNAIFERDHFACQKCGIKSGCGKKIILNADHIKPYALFPKIRYDISNGQTLCYDCHKIKTSWELKHYWKNQFGQSDNFKNLIVKEKSSNMVI